MQKICQNIWDLDNVQMNLVYMRIWIVLLPKIKILLQKVWESTIYLSIQSLGMWNMS